MLMPQEEFDRLVREQGEELAREILAIREVMAKDMLEQRIPAPDSVPLMQTMYDADTGILRVGLKHRLLLTVELAYFTRTQIYELLARVLLMEAGKVGPGMAPFAGMPGGRVNA